jgi:prepilin-type N-terminal cleavage/methylation domain-containing protein
MLQFIRKIWEKHSDKPFISRVGFTLVEVLITLTIIGVIAAMAVPTLMTNIQNAEFKTAYKQAVSDIGQAFLVAQREGTWREQTTKFEFTSNVCTDNFNVLKNAFGVQKECSFDNLYDCWEQKGEKLYENTYPAPSSETSYHPALSFIDNSGRTWSMYTNAENIIIVDTNGNKGPNWFGKDRWIFVPKDNTNTRLANANNFGLPVKISPYFEDMKTYNKDWCQHYPCYYQSWLNGSK